MAFPLEQTIFTIVGSALAVMVGIFIRRLSKLKVITTENFRKNQTDQRELHDEHFVLRKDFDTHIEKNEISNKQHAQFICRREFEKFEEDCIKCQKELPEKYITCKEAQRLIDRLEDIHREDVNGVYTTMKGGFEGIGKRIDNLIDKERNEKS